MKVLFVGDSPSAKNTDANVAFVGTQSGRRLEEWARTLGVTYQAVNSDDPVALKAYVRSAVLLNMPIVVLGTAAYSRTMRILENSLSGMKLDNTHMPFMLPHPSGLNRTLNDKKFVAKILSQCKDWLIKTGLDDF